MFVEYNQFGNVLGFRHLKGRNEGVCLKQYQTGKKKRKKQTSKGPESTPKSQMLRNDKRNSQDNVGMKAHMGRDDLAGY